MVAQRVAGDRLVAVFASPAQRAQRTAALAGLTVTRTDPDLWEWDYGGYEGITTAEIQQDAAGLVAVAGRGHPRRRASTRARPSTRSASGSTGYSSGPSRCWPTATSPWSRTGTCCGC